MSGHTPGPWRVADGNSILANWTDRVQVALTAITHWSYPDEGRNNRMREESAANARLIAAAPDLLRALQHAVEILDEQGCDCGTAVFPDEAIQCALCEGQAAIAKAEVK